MSGEGIRLTFAPGGGQRQLAKTIYTERSQHLDF